MRVSSRTGIFFLNMTPFESLFDRVIGLTGPTASGKSELALGVAERLANEDGGVRIEIISLDSIAVYRGMDIGSAKPTLDERNRVVHHLIDIVDPHEEFSVAAYLERAHRCVEKILGRGHVPMFVGGTPMYLKAILKGFHPGPPADETFRQAVFDDVQRYGIAALRRRLEQIDPLSANKIHPTDVRRMTRALEFAKAVGVPMSHVQTHFHRNQNAEDGLVFALKMPRAVLHQRIEQRVERMFQLGLIDEARSLLNDTQSLSKTARTAVGYREIFDAVDATTDETSTTTWNVDAIAEQVLFHTRRLARRQETWLRSFSEIRPIPTHHSERVRPIEELIDEIAGSVKENWQRISGNIEQHRTTGTN